jgi:hypothetical protein
MSPRDFSGIEDAIHSTDPEDIALDRLWGPWQAFSVAEAAAAMAAYDEPWWVCGGHAIEAFTGVPRLHDDIDVGFFTSHLDALRVALDDAFDLWSVGSMTFRPLTSETPRLHDGSEQVWVREHAWAPWRMDLLATPDDDGRWVNKRDPATVLPLEEATWVGEDGVRYLDADLALVMKAKHTRPKDVRDLEATLPLLDEQARARLGRLLARAHPGHAWLDRL